MESERQSGWEKPTLSVCGVSVVERLLALADGGGERQVGLHHPLLTAVYHRLGGHRERVALRDILGQSGQRLLCLRDETERIHELKLKHTRMSLSTHISMCIFIHA